MNFFKKRRKKKLDAKNAEVEESKKKLDAKIAEVKESKKGYVKIWESTPENNFIESYEKSYVFGGIIRTLDIYEQLQKSGVFVQKINVHASLENQAAWSMDYSDINKFAQNYSYCAECYDDVFSSIEGLYNNHEFKLYIFEDDGYLSLSSPTDIEITDLIDIE